MKFFNNQLGGYRIVDFGETQLSSTAVIIPGIWAYVKALPSNVPLLFYTAGHVYWGSFHHISDTSAYIYLLGYTEIRIGSDSNVKILPHSDMNNIAASYDKLSKYANSEMVPMIPPAMPADNGKILKVVNGEYKLVTP